MKLVTILLVLIVVLCFSSAQEVTNGSIIDDYVNQTSFPTELITNQTTTSDAIHSTEPTTQSSTQPLIESSTQPSIESSTESSIQPLTEPSTDPSTDRTSMTLSSVGDHYSTSTKLPDEFPISNNMIIIIHYSIDACLILFEGGNNSNESVPIEVWTAPTPYTFRPPKYQQLPQNDWFNYVFVLIFLCAVAWTYSGPERT